MDTDLSKCLRHIYLEFDVTADVSATEPDLLEEFADEVSERIRKPGLAASTRLLALIGWGGVAQGQAPRSEQSRRLASSVNDRRGLGKNVLFAPPGIESRPVGQWSHGKWNF